MFDRRVDTSALIAAAGLMLALSLVLIGTAVFTQLVLGWAPCVLCLTQRLPHYVLIATVAPLMALSIAVPHQRRALLLVAVGIAVLCLLGALLVAGFHSGVELRIWPGPQNCGGNTSISLSANDLFGSPVVDCTKPQLMFPGLIPGLSMANAHFLLVLGGLGISARRLIAGRFI